MKRTSMLALALVVLMWHSPTAAATTTTPLVPNDVGHWLNLEQRTGRLAPEITENRIFVQTILVVERSLAKLDAYLTDTRMTSGCHELLLPYARITREPYSEVDDQGNILLTSRTVRREAWLPVGVCSSIDQRTVYWEIDGALIILGRPRAETGGFPRTVYALFRVSAEERARWTQRNERLASRGKSPKPPKIETLYMPPGVEHIIPNKDQKISPFGAEFGLPTITAGHLASERPTSGQPIPEVDRPDR
jgi:hypothetical protein